MARKKDQFDPRSKCCVQGLAWGGCQGCTKKQTITNTSINAKSNGSTTRIVSLEQARAKAPVTGPAKLYAAPEAVATF